MIGAKKTNELYRRLKALVNFPDGEKEPERSTEVMRAIQQASKSDDHGRLVIERIIQTEEFFPAPSKIWAAAESITDPKAPPPMVVPGGCDACAGAAWIYVERNGQGGVARCTCERGQHLRARDAERTAASQDETTHKIPATDSDVVTVQVKGMPR